jgi:hypothetical protein
MIAHKPNARSYIVELDITIAHNDIDLATMISHPAELARLHDVQNKSQEVRVVGLGSREGIEGMHQGKRETMRGDLWVESRS